MLKVLQIENVAVIEKSDIEFKTGLNIMTGETGAGKSIVIDSLGAAIGLRTTRDLVRTGAESAKVTAVFDAVGTENWCSENDVDADDGELVIVRKISADGKSSCRVNGSIVSVGQLRELGQQLLDIHGQSDGQKLMNEGFHRQYLDSFTGLADDIAEFKEKYREYIEVLNKVKSLEMDESEKARKTDLLKYQIQELERADIKEGEQEALAARRDTMKNAGKLTELIKEAFIALDGGEYGTGAGNMIGDAEGAASSGARYMEKLSDISARLTELRYGVEDIIEELRELKDSLEFSPEEYDQLESRLDTLRRLSRKYGGSETEMLEYLEKCRRELENIEYSDEMLAKLEKQLEAKRRAAEKTAGTLSEKRKAGAKVLEKRIKEELSQLSMAGVRFMVEFTPCELTSNGADEVRFLMSANAGQELGRISKIASGGELARIMLAMKNVLAENDTVGTMVFDEVDTGVSGIAAQRVGEKLSDLSRDRQVICVTHLPQIAVMADTHFEIRKNQSESSTYTVVSELDAVGRVAETARLLGGENVSDAVLSAAKAQIAAAAEYKKQK